MTETAVAELAPAVGTAAACRALVGSRAGRLPPPIAASGSGAGTTVTVAAGAVHGRA